MCVTWKGVLMCVACPTASSLPIFSVSFAPHAASFCCVLSAPKSFPLILHVIESFLPLRLLAHCILPLASPSFCASLSSSSSSFSSASSFSFLSSVFSHAPLPPTLPPLSSSFTCPSSSSLSWILFLLLDPRPPPSLSSSSSLCLRLPEVPQGSRGQQRGASWELLGPRGAFILGTPGVSWDFLRLPGIS